MRKLAAIAVISVLFSAGSAKADFLQDLFVDGGQSKAEDTFEGVYCQGKTGTYKRNQSCIFGDKKLSKETYDRLVGKKSSAENTKVKKPTNPQIHYCKSTGGFLYEKKVSCELSGDEETTKAEYDRLKGKKSSAASKPKQEGAFAEEATGAEKLSSRAINSLEVYDTSAGKALDNAVLAFTTAMYDGTQRAYRLPILNYDDLKVTAERPDKFGRWYDVEVTITPYRGSDGQRGITYETDVSGKEFGTFTFQPASFTKEFETTFKQLLQNDGARSITLSNARKILKPQEFFCLNKFSGHRTKPGLWRDCSGDSSLEEITKAEYERIKSTTFYCLDGNSAAVSREGKLCGGMKEITKAEYEAITNKTFYCLRSGGTVTAQKGRRCGSMKEITKAEYEAIPNKIFYCLRPNGYVKAQKGRRCDSIYMKEITKAEYEEYEHKRKRQDDQPCINASGKVFSQRKNLGCGQGYKITWEEYDVLSEKVEETVEETKALSDLLTRAPTEEETPLLDDLTLCRNLAVREIPYLKVEVEKRYLNCENLLTLHEREQ